MSKDSSDEVEVIADNQKILESLETLDIESTNNFKARTTLLKDPKFSPYPKVSFPVMAFQQDSASSRNDIIVSKTDVQCLINAIPEYYPGQNLSIFINEIDNLINHLKDRLTEDLVYLVNFSIRSKIKGEARDFIAYQNVCDWIDIKRVLLQKYGDQRSEELLTSSLTQCVQRRNECYSDYYSRILKNFNDLMQYISLNETDTAILNFKKIEYTRLALKTFQIGLLEPYRSYISNFELKTLEECINKCRFYDNRKQEWEYSEFIRRSQDPSNRKIQQSAPIQKRQSLPSFQNRYFNSTPNQVYHTPTQSHSNHFRAQSNQPNFSVNKSYNERGFPYPINNKPPPNNTKPPTNKTVFGTKPGSSFSKIQPKPTPMSIQTSTFNMRQPQRPMYQHYQPKPNFTSEELYNVDYENPTDQNYYPDYTDLQEDFYEQEQPDEESSENENFRMDASEH